MFAVSVTLSGITKKIYWVSPLLNMVDVSVPDFIAQRNAYKDIYEQYVDEASFLWVLRSIAVDQPHYYKEDIVELEQRIEAQLDGLMTAPDMAWAICDDALELEGPGEVFTAAALSMRSHEKNRIQKAVEIGLANPLATPGLISALGWLPESIAKPWIVRLLQGKDMNHKFLGVAGCSVRRLDPGEVLTSLLMRDDVKQNEKLFARALRLIGELRRQDCMPFINEAISCKNPEIKFWAIWSAILLGLKSTAHQLEPYVLSANPLQERAIHIAFRTLTIDDARNWISQMANDPAQARAVIKATGVLGDPHAINWLIAKMQEHDLARLAAESFSCITGVDLEKHELNIDVEIDPVPNEDPDDDFVGLDQDENLPYPDVNKIASIWRNHGQNFMVGRRYFMGKQLSPALCKEKLENGTQRQRHTAAMELVLMEGNIILPNTRARVLVS